MMVVTGASGRLGRLVIEDLLTRGVPAGDIVAVVRTPEKVAALRSRGVGVRQADYDDPRSLAAAFAGADKVLLISSSEVSRRLVQHRNVVDAASAAGVGLLAYTSILNADTSRLMLAADHTATEAMIREAGLPYAFLRNGWYVENYTGNLAAWLRAGTIPGCAGEGRVAAAARADYAAAAATVLATEGHHNAVYELGGDEPFTMAEFAAEVTHQSGTAVVYVDMSPEEYVRTLVAQGLSEPEAAALADADAGVARGELTTDVDDLRRLIERPTTSLDEAVALALTLLPKSAV